VKSLSPDASPEVAAAQRSRFVREARALARFDHPGIVRVYEVFEEAGTAHLVMELLNGRSVAAELLARGGPLLAVEVEALAAGVARSLAVVHDAGMLHRDVSPSNVVLVWDGDAARRPVLIDFGLARAVDELSDDTRTRMVTPGFAPPEQYEGASQLGPASDVYGLAATLYHACTGRLPPNAVERQRGARIEPLRRVRADLPRAFCDGVHDGLELNPEHRPPDMPTFLARLGLTGEAPPMQLAPEAAAREAREVDVVLPWPPTGQTAERAPRAGPPRWATVAPLLLLSAAVGTLAPIAGTALLVAGVLPTVATIGELLRGRRRATLPWRFARNLAACVSACLPALLLATGGSVVAWLIDRAEGPTTADDVAASIAGAIAALVAVTRIVGDRAATAAADAVDLWSRRARDGLLLGAWALGLLAVAGALILRPDLWPLSPS
jgi:hypothetical protein